MSESDKSNETLRKLPGTLDDIEKSDGNRSPKRFQYSLGRLLIVTNLLGVIVAVIIATNGLAILVAITIGVMCAFLLPALALIFITSVGVYEQLFGHVSTPLWSSKIKPKAPRSPFDD